jgi:uncharacterized heparinase superfamily protein
MKPPNEKEAAPSKNAAPPQLIADGTLSQPETIDEFSWRHNVTRRTVHRWLKAGLLIVTHTPSGRPRIHGEKP